MLNVEPVRDPNKFKEILSAAKFQVPEWKPNAAFADKVKAELKDEAKGRNAETETGSEQAVVADDFDEVVKELTGFDVSGLKQLAVADFEKDDDTNFHIGMNSTPPSFNNV